MNNKDKQAIDELLNEVEVCLSSLDRIASIASSIPYITDNLRKNMIALSIQIECYKHINKIHNKID